MSYPPQKFSNQLYLGPKRPGAFPFKFYKSIHEENSVPQSRSFSWDDVIECEVLTFRTLLMEWYSVVSVVSLSVGPRRLFPG